MNGKKFVFPEFKFNSSSFSIYVPSGEISWRLLYGVYERDEKLEGNLRKAPKLTYGTTHPGDNKQNVQLALNVFHETTVAAIKSYFPERNDAAQFLNLVQTWWTICNSKNRFSPNRLGNAITSGDERLLFLKSFSEWVSAWRCEKFSLTAQTSSALICTLNCTASLTEDLLNEGYDFVMMSRFQSDPIERRFSSYRRMSGVDF